VEHAGDIVAFLRQSGQLLRQGGIIILTTPNRTVYDESVLWETELPPVHFWWLSEDAVRQLGEKCGCSVELVDFSEFHARHRTVVNLRVPPSVPTRLPAFGADGKLIRRADLQASSALHRLLRNLAATTPILSVYRRLRSRFTGSRLRGSRGESICAVFTKAKAAGNPEHCPRIGVVLVNWNTGELTKACIQSLLAGDTKPDRIVVFDNESKDSSPDDISRSFPNIELIRSSLNIGFAAACNAGIRRLSAGTDVIWLLNNDTVVDRRCLAELLKELQQPGVSVATAKILLLDDPSRLWYAGGIWHQWSFSPSHRGVFEQDTGQYDTPCDTDFVSGCCIAAHTAVFDKVGLLNEQFFAYVEDAEWCVRAKASGARMRYQPRAVLRHKSSASVQKNTNQRVQGPSPLIIYLTVRNHLFLIRLHAKRPVQATVATAHLIGKSMYSSIRLLLTCRFRVMASLWRGVKDGLSHTILPR